MHGYTTGLTVILPIHSIKLYSKLKMLSEDVLSLNQLLNTATGSVSKARTHRDARFHWRYR